MCQAVGLTIYIVINLWRKVFVGALMLKQFSSNDVGRLCVGIKNKILKITKSMKQLLKMQGHRYDIYLDNLLHWALI
jgi:hypothetical protein